MLLGGRKKIQEDRAQTAGEMKLEMQTQLATLRQWIADRMDQTEQKAGDIQDRIDELQKLQRRQTQSYEDYLEEEQSRTAIEEDLQLRAKEAEAREERLLALVCCYQEQTYMLQKQIEEAFGENGEMAAAWRRQLEIMEDSLQQQRRPCAVEETGRIGELVDYGCYEILNVIDTEDEALSGRVAEVFSTGCIYRGRVIRKARVAAYRRDKYNDDYRN